MKRLCPLGAQFRKEGRKEKRRQADREAAGGRIQRHIKGEGEGEEGGGGGGGGGGGAFCSSRPSGFSSGLLRLAL